MKKANKMMALTMAAAMLVPQMAFAGESEQTTFNIFAGVSALSPDNSEKPLVQQMNEAMGVSIDWNCVSGDTLTEKKNLILNAGVDMPDAFMAALSRALRLHLIERRAGITFVRLHVRVMMNLAAQSVKNIQCVHASFFSLYFPISMGFVVIRLYSFSEASNLSLNGIIVLP